MCYLQMALVSMSRARMVGKASVARCLDVFAGNGVQGIFFAAKWESSLAHLPGALPNVVGCRQHAEQVTLVELNPRAVRFIK